MPGYRILGRKSFSLRNLDANISAEKGPNPMCVTRFSSEAFRVPSVVSLPSNVRGVGLFSPIEMDARQALSVWEAFLNYGSKQFLP